MQLALDISRRIKHCLGILWKPVGPSDSTRLPENDYEPSTSMHTPRHTFFPSCGNSGCQWGWAWFSLVFMRQGILQMFLWCSFTRYSWAWGNWRLLSRTVEHIVWNIFIPTWGKSYKRMVAINRSTTSRFWRRFKIEVTYISPLLVCHLKQHLWALRGSLVILR